MKAKNLYKINCLIESFDTNDKDKAVYYKLNLYSSLSKSSWTVERRYQDFHNYHSILSKNFFHLPEIPSKTLTRLTSMEDLAIRKELLEAFCQVSSLT